MGSLELVSQTCCTAGVPVSSYFDIPDTEVKSFSFQLAFEYQSINRLIDNDEQLSNDPRARAGQNINFKLDYRLTEKWAFSALIPYILQQRNTVSENQSSHGIGDLIVFSEYTLYADELKAFGLAAGIKLPTGTNDLVGSSGIFLSPDMQAGSGTVDYTLRANFSLFNFLTPFLNVSANVFYRNNGINNHFGSTDTFDGRRFGFGDELSTGLNLNYQLIYSHGIVVPDIGIKARRTNANVENNTEAPNSGGSWYSIPFGVSYAPNINQSMRAYIELPIHQRLNGLQITSDLIAGIQFKYTPKSKEELIITN